jgi:hypothetical protein
MATGLMGVRRQSLPICHSLGIGLVTEPARLDRLVILANFDATF